MTSLFNKDTHKFDSSNTYKYNNNMVIIKDQIEKLDERKRKLEKELRTINQIVEKMREVCPHTHANGNSAWVDMGTGHKDTQYKCLICGEVKYE